MPRQFPGKAQPIDFAQSTFVRNLPIAMDWCLLESSPTSLGVFSRANGRNSFSELLGCVIRMTPAGPVIPPLSQQFQRAGLIRSNKAFPSQAIRFQDLGRASPDLGILIRLRSEFGYSINEFPSFPRESRVIAKVALHKRPGFSLVISRAYEKVNGLAGIAEDQPKSSPTFPWVFGTFDCKQHYFGSFER